MAETPRNHDQARSATPVQRPAVAESEPQRDGDYGLGIPPSTAGEGRVHPKTEVEEREQARTLVPNLGSDVADKDLLRDGDHGLGRPPPTTERGRELTSGENRQRDRQEKEQDQEQIRREFERVLQQEKKRAEKDLTYQEQVDRLVAKGWRIDRQTDTYTVLHKGEAIGCAPQFMDIVLIFVTGGLWLIVYLVQLSFFGLRERRVVKLPSGSGYVERPKMFRW